MENVIPIMILAYIMVILWKIGNVNKFRLVNYIKNTMTKVTKIHREIENKENAKILGDPRLRGKTFKNQGRCKQH